MMPPKKAIETKYFCAKKPSNEGNVEKHGNSTTKHQIEEPHNAKRESRYRFYDICMNIHAHANTDFDYDGCPHIWIEEKKSFQDNVGSFALLLALFKPADYIAWGNVKLAFDMWVHRERQHVCVNQTIDGAMYSGTNSQIIGSSTNNCRFLFLADFREYNN